MENPTYEPGTERRVSAYFNPAAVPDDLRWRQFRQEGTVFAGKTGESLQVETLAPALSRQGR